MAGIAPKTRFLVTRNKTVVSDCANWREVADALGVSITKGGFVVAGGVRRNPSYIMQAEHGSNGFSPDEARADWVRMHSGSYFKGNAIAVYRYIAD